MSAKRKLTTIFKRIIVNRTRNGFYIKVNGYFQDSDSFIIPYKDINGICEEAFVQYIKNLLTESYGSEPQSTVEFVSLQHAAEEVVKKIWGAK